MNGPVDVAATRARQGGRLAGFDGLRALGLLLVVVFHVDPRWLPGGFGGVDLFFVVSGYLITTLLVREYEATGRLDVFGFYQRRVRRLLPASLLVVLVAASAGLLLGGDLLVGLAPNIVGALTMSSNWVQLVQGSDYFARTQPGLLDNFWSLAIEEQFYLLWPAALLALLTARRSNTVRQRLILMVALAGIAPIVLGLTGAGDAAYLITFTHAFGLLLGGLLALQLESGGSAALLRAARHVWAGRSLLLLGVAGLAVLVLSPLAGVPQWRPAVTVLASLAAAALVVGCRLSTPARAARLDGGIGGWIGRRSYGLYLWHFPLIVLADSVIPPVAGSGALPGRLLAVVATLLMADLSFRFIEMPIRASGFRRVLRRPIAAVAALAVLGGVALATPAVAAHAPSTTALETRISAPATSDARPEAPSAEVAPTPDERAESMTDPSKVLIIGDSVALASESGIRTTFPGVVFDAHQNRQLADAPELVREHLSNDPSISAVVIGLGINGVGGTSDLRNAIAAADGRDVVLVNVSGPVGWESSINADITDAASSADDVAIADWRSAAQAHPNLIAADGIHPGAKGGELYAQSIESALASLR